MIMNDHLITLLPVFSTYTLLSGSAGRLTSIGTSLSDIQNNLPEINEKFAVQNHGTLRPNSPLLIQSASPVKIIFCSLLPTFLDNATTVL